MRERSATPVLYPAATDVKTEIWPYRAISTKLRSATNMHTDRAFDRRRLRSNDPLTAVHHQLTFARDEAELDALVLADTTGCLVARAGALSECELLAAHAPLREDQWPWSADLGPAPRTDVRVDAGFDDVEVRRLQVDGSELLLCAKGGGALRQTWMQRAAEGCARILGT